MTLPLFIAHLQVLQSNIAKETKKTPQVLLSTDEEGNAFGDIDIRYSFGYDKDSNTLVIYPVNTEYQS